MSVLDPPGKWDLEETGHSLTASIDSGEHLEESHDPEKLGEKVDPWMAKIRDPTQVICG
jgi:hypothetical protein